MDNNSGAGLGLVLRVMLAQAACAVSVALMFWLVRDGAEAWSGLIGGMIVVVGSGLFGWRFFAPGIAPATVLRRALFAAESLKWLWYVVSIWASLARLKLVPLPLLTGLMVGQIGYWLGLMGKRGKSNGSV